MTDAAYQDVIQALGDETRKRAGELSDFLVTQPPRRLAMRAALDFGWWCLGEGAKHAHDVQERMHRTVLSQQGRQSAGATSEE
jgi:hypothetical protein